MTKEATMARLVSAALLLSVVFAIGGRSVFGQPAWATHHRNDRWDRHDQARRVGHRQQRL